MDPIASLIPIFIASFLGSSHCVAMCGPFTLLFRGKPEAILAYHIGRLCSYVALGSLAGLVGQGLFATFPYLVLPLLSTSIFVLYFLWLAYQVIWNRPWQPPLPNFLKQSVRGISLPKSSPILQGGAIGLTSVLLPCGWLYSFLVGAVAMHSGTMGALWMFSFWLGSIPALTIAPTLLESLGIAGRLSPRWRASLLLFIGLSGVTLKLNGDHQASSKDAAASCVFSVDHQHPKQ